MTSNTWPATLRRRNRNRRKHTVSRHTLRIRFLRSEPGEQRTIPPARCRAQCVQCPFCQQWREQHLSLDDADAEERSLYKSLDCGHGGRERIFRSRPCVFVGCRWNLYLDTSRNGSITINFPDVEPGDMVSSCALDVADQGPQELERVAAHMNLTRERVRQVQNIAMGKLKAHRHLPVLNP